MRREFMDVRIDETIICKYFSFDWPQGSLQWFINKAIAACTCINCKFIKIWVVKSIVHLSIPLPIAISYLALTTQYTSQWMSCTENLAFQQAFSLIFDTPAEISSSSQIRHDSHRVIACFSVVLFVGNVRLILLPLYEPLTDLARYRTLYCTAPRVCVIYFFKDQSRRQTLSCIMETLLCFDHYSTKQTPEIHILLHYLHINYCKDFVKEPWSFTIDVSLSSCRMIEVHWNDETRSRIIPIACEFNNSILEFSMSYITWWTLSAIWISQSPQIQICHRSQSRRSKLCTWFRVRDSSWASSSHGEIAAILRLRNDCFMIYSWLDFCFRRSDWFRSRNGGKTHSMITKDKPLMLVTKRSVVWSHWLEFKRTILFYCIWNRDTEVSE